MQTRKKQILDGIDREILRLLYKEGPLVGRKIANFVGLTSSAIAPRLNNLKKMEILKPVKIMKIRSFNRKFKNSKKRINASRGIIWGIDLKKE